MSKTLFNHIDAIYTNQSKTYFDNLSESDAKTWNNWMINRFVSMNADYVELVNEVQKYYQFVQNRELYLFYSQIIPKKKQFNRYIKAEKSQVYEDWLIEILCKHFSLGTDQITEYLNIFYQSDVGKSALRDILVGYGIDSKKLKKVKL